MHSEVRIHEHRAFVRPDSSKKGVRRAQIPDPGMWFVSGDGLPHNDDASGGLFGREDRHVTAGMNVGCLELTGAEMRVDGRRIAVGRACEEHQEKVR